MILASQMALDVTRLHRVDWARHVLTVLMIVNV